MTLYLNPSNCQLLPSYINIGFLVHSSSRSTCPIFCVVPLPPGAAAVFFRQFQCISINHGSTIEEQSGHRRRRRWREKLRAAGDRTVQLSPRGAMNAADGCTACALFCCNPAALGGTSRISRAEPGRARLLTSRPSRWLVSHCQTEHKSQDKVGDDAPADRPPCCHGGKSKNSLSGTPAKPSISQTRRRFSRCGYLRLVAGAFCLVCIC